MTTAEAAFSRTEQRAPEPLPEGTGCIDEAYFLRSLSADGGYLIVSGWFSLISDKPQRPERARLRLGEEQWEVPWGLSRLDVAAANPRFSANSGFSVTLPVAQAPGPGSQFSMTFSSGGSICGRLAHAVEFPDAEVEAEAATLTPLRLKKLRNLLVNERERLSHAERVRSMPVTGQIDPAFACNLECPLCLSHMLREDRFLRPVLKSDQLDTILDKYGDYLIRIWMSLWGEPLLNKQLPSLIAKCKERDIWVLISSNMSVPLKDETIDGLVTSGLDSINLSIDGATQATYEKYRRGGDLELVLDNVRRLVAAKRRLNSASPHLIWRFLEFPWTRHEIEAARQLAAEIGVDEFGVSPGVMTPQTKHSLSERPAREPLQYAEPDLLAQRQQEARDRGNEYQYFGCDYLYQGLSINSDGVVHPCCYVVSPAHAIGRSDDTVNAMRNGDVLRSGRRFYQRLADGAKSVGCHEPCLSCSVVTSTAGHVTTQTNFRQLYEYLLRGVPMRW
jgi:MoaA/NifB/PqqE/SkfB family radical SAM enzyme